MTTVYQIPLQGGQPETFLISLSGVSYRLVFQYRNTDIAGGAGWVVDFLDQFSNPILCGLPLVTGTNLLGQYEYLDFLGGLSLYTDGTPNAVPTFQGLGIDTRVYWVTNP